MIRYSNGDPVELGGYIKTASIDLGRVIRVNSNNIVIEVLKSYNFIKPIVSRGPEAIILKPNLEDCI